MVCHHSLKGCVDLRLARLAERTEEDAQDEIAEYAGAMDAAWKKTLKGAMGGRPNQKWIDEFKKTRAKQVEARLREIHLEVPADDDEYEENRILVLTADTKTEA